MRKTIPMILVAVIFLTSISFVEGASSAYTVNLLVAYDEEFAYTAYWFYGYSPITLASLIIDITYDRFCEIFNIHYIIMACWSWDSDDNVTDPEGMMDEVIQETGFETGMEIPGGYVVHILVAFTDQDIDGRIVGIANATLGAVLVEEYYSGGQLTDHVLQHELSHLYDAEDHVDHRICIMDYYRAIETENWCSECNDVISSNQEIWGEPGTPGGAGCPTLFVWNGTKYAEEDILDIHADSDVTVQHEIENTLVLENWVYKVQLRELDNFTSHIDQVRLYAVDGEGEQHNCPLIYARKNDSYVLWKLLFDDENRVDLTPTQIIDLKLLPSIQYGETEYFIFQINGYNQKEAW